MSAPRKVKGGGYAGQYHLPVGPWTCEDCAHGYDKKGAVERDHQRATMRCRLTRKVDVKRATRFPQEATCCKKHSDLAKADAAT